MWNQMCFLCAGALGAVKGFLISVDHLMSMQVTWLLEFLDTLWAADRFLSRLDPIMGLQSTWCGECRITLWAAVWFLICVDSLVILQMFWSWALVVTLWEVRNVTNNAVIKCVITALFICTSKNSVFSDFLLRLNRKSGFFFTKTWPYVSGLI